MTLKQRQDKGNQCHIRLVLAAIGKRYNNNFFFVKTFALLLVLFYLMAIFSRHDIPFSMTKIREARINYCLWWHKSHDNLAYGNMYKKTLYQYIA